MDYVYKSTCFIFSGLFSSIMRDQSNLTHDSPKWIVLDGDIDPMWIESLNTVMDDNKVNSGRVTAVLFNSFCLVPAYQQMCQNVRPGHSIYMDGLLF